jgi:hypothetical protein
MYKWPYHPKNGTYVHKESDSARNAWRGKCEALSIADKIESRENVKRLILIAESKRGRRWLGGFCSCVSRGRRWLASGGAILTLTLSNNKVMDKRDSLLDGAKGAKTTLAYLVKKDRTRYHRLRDAYFRLNGYERDDTRKGSTEHLVRVRVRIKDWIIVAALPEFTEGEIAKMEEYEVEMSKDVTTHYVRDKDGAKFTSLRDAALSLTLDELKGTLLRAESYLTAHSTLGFKTPVIRYAHERVVLEEVLKELTEEKRMAMDKPKLEGVYFKRYEDAGEMVAEHLILFSGKEVTALIFTETESNVESVTFAKVTLEYPALKGYTFLTNLIEWQEILESLARKVRVLGGMHQVFSDRLTDSLHFGHDLAGAARDRFSVDGESLRTGGWISLEEPVKKEYVDREILGDTHYDSPLAKERRERLRKDKGV